MSIIEDDPGRTMFLWTFLILIFLVGLTVGLRVWYRSWRRRRIAARRIVEKPNSFYSSALVKHQEEREKWEQLDLDQLHPVNREEVERLLEVVDVQGADALSPKDRLFLENMTRLSFG